MGDYLRGLDLPIIDLTADGLPDEYRDIHPPAAVIEWYADRIAEALKAEQGLRAKARAARHDHRRGGRARYGSLLDFHAAKVAGKKALDRSRSGR